MPNPYRQIGFVSGGDGNTAPRVLNAYAQIGFVSVGDGKRTAAPSRRLAPHHPEWPALRDAYAGGDLPQAVLADWLEEIGDTRSAFVRGARPSPAHDGAMLPEPPEAQRRRVLAILADGGRDDGSEVSVYDAGGNLLDPQAEVCEHPWHESFRKAVLQGPPRWTPGMAVRAMYAAAAWHHALPDVCAQLAGIAGVLVRTVRNYELLRDRLPRAALEQDASRILEGWFPFNASRA